MICFLGQEKPIHESLLAILQTYIYNFCTVSLKFSYFRSVDIQVSLNYLYISFKTLQGTISH